MSASADARPISRRALLAAATTAPFAAAAADRLPEPGRRTWASEVPVLRIGLLGGENEADRLGRYGAYRALLEETFEIPVRLFAAADYAGVGQAFAAGQIELSTMSPAAYAAVWLDTHGAVEPILVTQEADGSTSYIAAMYVRADSGITDIAGLRGKAMAWADPNSASGYLIPRAELRAAGYDPEAGRFFSRTGFAGGHEQAVVAVLQRQYDAGVAWVSGIGDPLQGFTRGVLHTMVEKGMLDMRDLRIIWKSRPIQSGPIVVRSALPRSFKDDMIAFHMALPKAAPAVHQAIERGSAIGWVPTRHEDYAVFVEMRQAEAAARRAR
ncbi:MAG: phosphate/phosphite/phosphonate ABC transporter substrate-binding protein [Acetobacteraceae bacterium]|nr:phosphate/phosphite/phosphonate ABC transporter substrate-binding protein [Acetobacteraceae bacterium]